MTGNKDGSGKEEKTRNVEQLTDEKLTEVSGGHSRCEPGMVRYDFEHGYVLSSFVCVPSANAPPCEPLRKGGCVPAAWR
ncbi:MAG: hypothetical protein RIN56_10050 [Sporomusaceae bacterium]|nr:hypothetical protein [Sporomusaceae bacterium]